MTPSRFFPIHFGTNIPAGGFRSPRPAHRPHWRAEPWGRAP